MITQLYTPKLELSGLTDATGEVLRFAFRGETITDVLEDYDLDTLRSLMDPWQATFTDSAEVWTILAGPYIEREEILPLLPNCKKLERAIPFMGEPMEPRIITEQDEYF